MFIPRCVLNKNNANSLCKTLFFRNVSSLRVFENNLLETILDPKREKITEQRGNVLNEEPHNLHFSQNIISVVKSMRIRRAGHVASKGR
jgi:hypothetical protein